ncbi:MAG TPA: SRPBCC family protein [Gemmatimonadaceae bacterium]|nr:SRPBCC family protein [Gemmatimonadaceae bacterium]
MTAGARPIDLGPMPIGRPMVTVDEQLVRAPISTIFELAKRVERWPEHLSHYRYVRFREQRPDGGGVVEMSAYRPFDAAVPALRFNWPTWWLSEMMVNATVPCVRFRHVGGITTGMEVEWAFTPVPNGTHVRILHVWDGPPIPVLGTWAATHLIGPVFVHGIASRTLAGLAAVAERDEGRGTRGEGRGGTAVIRGNR